MPSIFHNLDPALVVRDPFPHICVEGLLDDELCRQLAAEIVPLQELTGGRGYSDDEKFYRYGPELLANPETSECLKRFIAENVTADAYRDFYRLFEADIAREFPKLAHRLAKVAPSRIGQRTSPRARSRDRARDKKLDVHMDVLQVYFMPVRGTDAAERGPHLKTSEKIFNGFLCLRTDEDNSTGGDQVLHGIQPGAPLSPGHRNQVDPKDIYAARTIPRQRNTFVGYLNTPRSVTEMTPRSTSPFPSVYLNIVVGLSPRMWRSSVFSLLRRRSWRRW
jgi:hypothetical protein